MCCDSAHKTLPVLTGGAYLHIGKDAPAPYEADARECLALFGSSSPSYLILQSLDHCNARLAGVGDVTGSLEVGKSEDLIVTRQNPLDDLRALQHLELVACRGRVVKKPAPKRNQIVDKLLDPYLE